MEVKRDLTVKHLNLTCFIWSLIENWRCKMCKATVGKNQQWQFNDWGWKYTNEGLISITKL
jgi:hypothetical protein